MKRDRMPSLLGATLAAVIVGGPLLPQWALFILTIAFAQGLVALGLMLLLRAGLVSFGQALYYCIGAYTAGGLARAFNVGDVFLQMIAGAATAALAAFILGFLLARYRGIFFGLLSLALSMILYGLIVKSEALGSTDGLNIAQSTLFGVRPAADWVRYAVAVAAAFAGMGGALAATTVGHTDPEMAYWTTSGEFIFIAILAGTGSVLAPFLGALLFGAIHTLAYDLSPHTWQMSLGTALLLVIVFLPEGLWSLFARRRTA